MDSAVTQAATLEMPADVRIVVPNSLNLLTPYVLFEQRDWFEDEIGFVRCLLQPGDRAIDVGANYGVYTLTMGKMVGSAGHVWAFEPASSTAAFLAQGIAANDFNHVVLERCAVSNACGTARLSLNDNSEFNALVGSDQSTAAIEIVPVVTLDECMQRYDWNDISFLKLDAEGAESSILQGGRKFFMECSPLVLYEVKSGLEPNLELVREFADMGYESYRLVPGLGILVPFDASSERDGFLLNLFCCKPARAALLAERGLLLTSANINAATQPFDAFFLEHRGEYTWRRTLATTPYGATLAPLWEQTALLRDGDALVDALAYHAMSQDSALLPVQRYIALHSSFVRLRSLCSESPPPLRFLSLARVAGDYGTRSIGLSALQRVLPEISSRSRVDMSEPFLAPGDRFDAISPRANIADWLLAAGAEQFERVLTFSSFYTGNSARPRLELIAALGFASEEMGRRLSLIRARFGESAGGALPIV